MKDQFEAKKTKRTNPVQTLNLKGLGMYLD